MRIAGVENGMRDVNITGRIVNMSNYILVVEDESGRTFVRYSRRNLEKPIQTGNRVKIHGCQAVNYSGILQLRMQPNGRIALQQGLTAFESE